jgi:hypothetical protein
MHSPPPTSVPSRRVTEWQIVLWSIFSAAFVGAGSLPLRNITLRDRVTKQGPDSSTDTIFERDLLLQGATERILECLRTVPTDAKLAIVGRAGSSDSMPACLIQQLAWPRPTVAINTPEPPSTASDTLANAITESQAQAVFFLRSSPPPSVHTMDLSPLVQFCRLP